MVPRRPARALTAAIVILLPWACGDDPTGNGGSGCEVTAPLVSVFDDLDNLGDGRDLYVRLVSGALSECTGGFRLVISKDASNPLTAGEVLELPEDRVMALDGALPTALIHFGGVGVDADGDPLEEGVPYRLQAVGFGEGDPTVATSATPATMTNADVVRTISESIDAGSGGLETDADGNIYTADFGAALSGPPGTQIHRVTPDGRVSVWARGFQGASGNDRAENGDLFQSSIQGGSIHRVSPSGSVSLFATGLSGPVGIVALPGDTLMVAGCGDNTIRRVEPDGSVSTFKSSGLFDCPNGITLAEDGNYYIAGFSDGRITRMTPGGDVSAIGRVPSNNAGHLLWGRGALWIVDRGGHRLYRSTLDGTMTVAAGTGTRGSRDGKALEATLSLTNDVAFSPDESILYFNDVAQSVQPSTVINPVVVRALIFARPE